MVVIQLLALTSREEDQQAIAKLQNHHKPPILLTGHLYLIVLSPLQVQQAL